MLTRNALRLLKLERLIGRLNVKIDMVIIRSSTFCGWLFSLFFFDVIPKSSRLFYDEERVTDCCYLSKEKKDFL
ncbi:hypothetical protein Q426_01790 [Streptococcus equi subsp. zooepidemicus CY]|nr:hypothetical protein Q426_01790 [Streptococcus equi subsp. zooepidemicus CY]